MIPSRAARVLNSLLNRIVEFAPWLGPWLRQSGPDCPELDGSQFIGDGLVVPNKYFQETYSGKVIQQQIQIPASEY